MRILQVNFKGLFGNQAITYAYCRALAERLGAELQTASWVGEILFEEVKPNPLRGKSDLDIRDCWFDLSAMEKADVVSVDYFMTVLSKEPGKDGLAGQQLMHFSKEQLRRWFRFKPQFVYQSPFEKVFHLRFWNPQVSNARADWYSNTVYPCANISFESYTKAAENFGYDLRGFEIVHEREPHTLPGIPTQLQLVVDFQICTQAKALFRANSSFSWLAAAIGCGKIYSPMMVGVNGAWNGAPQFCRFEEGNHGSFWPGGLVGQSEPQ